ncbi:amidohydrolase family protein [Pendulispora albinea]|uniref:Amidohydrolase family protein n=1 Tax=Pendulispora albinea TaxID=2741071 RepID=A0ABZ2LP07_9BACT
MIVDAHHHVWDLTVRDQGWIGDDLRKIRRNYSLDDLAPLAAESGVYATVLVQTIAVAEETPELLALASSSDLVAAVTGWVDLTSPSVGDDVARLLEGPGGRALRAIRHPVQGEADPSWLCREDVRRGLSAVADAGLVYELLILPHQLPAAERTVAALPHLQFVLDHGAKPPIAAGHMEPWGSALERLAAHPNVTCKLSGLVTEARWTTWTVEDLRPYVMLLVEAFGPERLIFGSDWPVCLLAAEYAEVLAASQQLTSALSTAERDAIFSGTARKIYRLPEPRA